MSLVSSIWIDPTVKSRAEQDDLSCRRSQCGQYNCTVLEMDIVVGPMWGCRAVAYERWAAGQPAGLHPAPRRVRSENSWSTTSKRPRVDATPSYSVSRRQSSHSTTRNFFVLQVNKKGKGACGRLRCHERRVALGAPAGSRKATQSCS
jgi:hypothetical protein